MLRRVEIKTFTPNPAPNGSGVRGGVRGDEVAAYTTAPK